MALENIRQIRSVDPKFGRHEEIERLLKSALEISGPRKGEVEKLKEQYEREHAAFLATPPAPVPPPTPAPAPAPVAPAPGNGPFELGPNGEIPQWLVLGPFPNRDHLEGLYDNDLLHTEEAHRPAVGLEVRTRQGTTLKWMRAAAVDGAVRFAALDFFGRAPDSREPAIAFAACWVEAQDEVEVKFRPRAEVGFTMQVDHKRAFNHPKGTLAAEEEVIRLKLSRGRHPLVFKVATFGGGSFGLGVRVTTSAGDRASGIRIWTCSEDGARTLFAENFDRGAGRFVGGEWVEGGLRGTHALAVGVKGTEIQNPFDVPVTPSLRLRFQVRMPPNVGEFAVTLFGKNARKVFWYKVRDFKPGEWTPVEVRLTDLREHIKMTGPSVEGDVPNNFRFILPDAPESARMLVDDVEIVEIP
jgi:hypothetical protein